MFNDFLFSPFVTDTTFVLCLFLSIVTGLIDITFDFLYHFLIIPRDPIIT